MDDTHNIIRREPVGEVMTHLQDLTHTTGHHLIAALKRRNLDIFAAVLAKANEFPYNLPINLIQAPQFIYTNALWQG